MKTEASILLTLELRDTSFDCIIEDFNLDYGDETKTTISVQKSYSQPNSVLLWRFDDSGDHIQVYSNDSLHFYLGEESHVISFDSLKKLLESR